MADIFESLINLVGTGDQLGQISSLLGADNSETQRGIAAALPALLGGLAKNSGSEGGAASLLGALDGHDGSILENLGGLAGALGDGGKILGHIFGDRQPAVAQAVGQKSGLDAGLIMKLLPMLAPIVMGYLGRQKQQQGLTQDSLRDQLTRERQGIQEKEPGLGGLMGFLDRDGDGDVMDDLGGMLGGGGNEGGGGGLGSILGKVLGQ